MLLQQPSLRPADVRAHAEEAALRAAEQLLEEEKRAQGKAAAKKAKKQRQKMKQQQQQLAALSALQQQLQQVSADAEQTHQALLQLQRAVSGPAQPVQERTKPQHTQQAASDEEAQQAQQQVGYGSDSRQQSASQQGQQSGADPSLVASPAGPSATGLVEPLVAQEGGPIGGPPGSAGLASPVRSLQQLFCCPLTQVGSHASPHSSCAWHLYSMHLGAVYCRQCWLLHHAAWLAQSSCYCHTQHMLSLQAAFTLHFGLPAVRDAQQLRMCWQVLCVWQTILTRFTHQLPRCYSTLHAPDASWLLALCSVSISTTVITGADG